MRGGAAIPGTVVGHRFNDDLLICPTDLAEARKRFPTIIHVLDHPELRVLFQKYDVPANAAKRRSRKWGVWAVIFGALAPVGAAAAPLFEHPTEAWSRVVAFLSALCGVVRVIIGLRGVLWYRAKTEWLHRRLMTERLRQFYFQAFVCRWPEIVNSLASRSAAEAYVAKRRLWFAAFIPRMEHGLVAEFTDLMQDIDEKDIWLYEPPVSSMSVNPAVSVDEFFEAYKVLRIDLQLRYANYKIRPGEGIFSASSYAQQSTFSTLSLIGIAALVLIHFGIVIAVASGLKELIPPHWIHVIAIWIALGALTIRAFEEGLQPARELERYQSYRLAVRAISNRFAAAKSPEEKIEVMNEMEQVSFDEMATFLKTNDTAQRPSSPAPGSRSDAGAALLAVGWTL